MTVINTTRQSSTWTPLAEVLAQQRVMPGIKVGYRGEPLAGCLETIMEGLDGLRDPLQEYRPKGSHSG